MESPYPISSLSSTPCSDEERQRSMDQKMKKRKLSNRESARRSRIRKQNHIEKLVDQVDQLKREQQQLKANLSLTRQLSMNIEAETSVIRAQMAELSYQLTSLNEISCYSRSMNLVNVGDHQSEYYHQMSVAESSFIMDPWNQPISASADIFMY
ncbi:unnamed protein product [Rhodiola kirilowii]